MKSPSSSALHLAAAWLDEWDSGDQDRADILAVAEWLREKAADADDRTIAKAKGITVERLRAVMKRTSHNSGVPVQMLREALLKKEIA